MEGRHFLPAPSAPSLRWIRVNKHFRMFILGRHVYTWYWPAEGSSLDRKVAPAPGWGRSILAVVCTSLKRGDSLEGVQVTTIIVWWRETENGQAEDRVVQSTHVHCATHVQLPD